MFRSMAFIWLTLSCLTICGCAINTLDAPPVRGSIIPSDAELVVTRRDFSEHIDLDAPTLEAVMREINELEWADTDLALVWEPRGSVCLYWVQNECVQKVIVADHVYWLTSQGIRIASDQAAASRVRKLVGS